MLASLVLFFFMTCFSFRFSRLIAYHIAPCANVSCPKKINHSRVSVGAKSVSPTTVHGTTSLGRVPSAKASTAHKKAHFAVVPCWVSRKALASRRAADAVFHLRCDGEGQWIKKELVQISAERSAYGHVSQLPRSFQEVGVVRLPVLHTVRPQ